MNHQVRIDKPPSGGLQGTLKYGRKMTIHDLIG